MVKTTRITVLVALLTVATASCGLAAQALSASTQHDPPWLLLELGKRAYYDRNFGQALDYFRTAIERGGTTPEAEMWIGRVFEQEGELGLAESQYARALADSSQFEIPGEATSIRYNLARIYDNTNQYGKYEVTLKKILASDSMYSDKSNAFTRQAMVRVLETDGLDKLLVLYRLDDKKTLAAHSDLGEFLYRTGRYSDAIVNLTFSTITVLTVAIDAFKAKDPVFEFSTVENLLGMAAKDKYVSDYLASTHFFRDLYYLAASLYADGKEERSESIWHVVTKWAPPGVWTRRAQAQLQHPHVEPVLNVGG